MSCDFSNITLYAMLDDLPPFAEDVKYELFRCVVATWTTALVVFAIYVWFVKKCYNLYIYLHLQHVVMGVVHITLLAVYHHLKLSLTQTALVYQTIFCLDLLIPMWTSCISMKMCLNLFVFKDGEEVFSALQVTIFLAINMTFMQVYEGFMVLLLTYIDWCVYSAYLVKPAVRLAPVLLAMGVAVQVAVVAIAYTIGQSIPYISLAKIDRKLALSFLLHLGVLTLSDVALVAFKVIIWKHTRTYDNNDFEDSTKMYPLIKRYSSDYYEYNFNEHLYKVVYFVSGRLILEMIWFIAIPFIKLPIYNIKHVT